MHMVLIEMEQKQIINVMEILILNIVYQIVLYMEYPIVQNVWMNIY